MLNEDEFQKSVGKKFRLPVGVSEFTVSLLIMCILEERQKISLNFVCGWVWFRGLLCYLGPHFKTS